MSTYNFQEELEGKFYAVQVSPFEDNGSMAYRVQYNDSSTIVFIWDDHLKEFRMKEIPADPVPENLEQRIIASIYRVQELSKEQ